jgi:Bacterial TSP3 repeat
VQILHLEDVIWEQEISPNPPVVSFVSPNGGVYDSTGTIPVQWAASDPDGGVLFFNLSYSPDNGATWYPLHTGLTGSSFDWMPFAIPAGSAVRLRLQASDGFNTASADSAAFTLNPYPPGAILHSPADGDTFTEGETITLNGGSITSAGDNLGDFDWLQDGALIGFGITNTVQLNFVGSSTFELQVHADGMTASDTATIEVLPDYDRDGMPNAWELAYEFNPFDPSNADEDPDGDTLSNLFEYQIGTNPLLADSDGDGFDDGWEVDEGTDPNDPTTLPLALIFLPVVNR